MALLDKFVKSYFQTSGSTDTFNIRGDLFASAIDLSEYRENKSPAKIKSNCKICIALERLAVAFMELGNFTLSYNGFWF